MLKIELNHPVVSYHCDKGGVDWRLERGEGGTWKPAGGYKEEDSIARRSIAGRVYILYIARRSTGYKEGYS